MFAQIITELRKSRTKLTQSDMAKVLGVAKTTYSSYEQGKRMPDMEIQKKLANYYDVSLDYLNGLDVKEKPYYELSAKEKKDIGIEAERMLEGLYTDAELDFYGEPMTDEEKERMKTILEMGLQLNKEKAKKKFTNKKYRNDSK